MQDPAYAPLTELSTAIQGGRLSPVDLMDHCLARIAKHDGKLAAFVTVYNEDARAAAEGAHKAIRSGHGVGPLHGIPIAMKDIVDIAGRVTTGGSKALRDRVSPVTATLVKRLVQAGMIVIGKTHTVEFAMGGWGTNTHMGTPWNPWDLETPRTPGGSSSGSGVAVASGMAPCAIGTDTGGSVRLPAAWCGLTGLKVTLGRISTHGVMPLAHTLDTPGPMVHTVGDAALLFNVLQGPDENDLLTLRRAPDDPMPTLRRGVAGLRIGQIPAEERNGVDSEMLAAYDNALDILSGMGATIIEVALPKRFHEMGEMTGRIIGAEGYSHVGDVVDNMDLPIDPDIRPRIWIGKDMSARDYLRAQQEREALKQAFNAALADVDALITPTTKSPALKLEDVDQSRTPAIFTRVFNILDRCALALPTGLSSGGLPLSMQIGCPAYDEATALRIGHAYQQTTDWHMRRPPGLDDRAP